MFKLFEIVEPQIKDEMNTAKGAVMYDGWTHNSIHYLGVFAVYMRTVAVFKNGFMSSESELALPLLAARSSASAMATPAFRVPQAHDC